MRLIKPPVDAVRERCAIVKDQITDMRAEQMNKNMMILSVVAAIFLPLGLISGMMGINVGGMPWVENAPLKRHSLYLLIRQALWIWQTRRKQKKISRELSEL